MSIKELDLEVKKVIWEAKGNHLLAETIVRYNGVNWYSKALFYVLDIKHYQNIFPRMATMLNLETGIPFIEAILEGKKVVGEYCKGKTINEHTSLDYLACEGYAEIIRKRCLDRKVVINNE